MGFRRAKLGLLLFVQCVALSNGMTTPPTFGLFGVGGNFGLDRLFNPIMPSSYGGGMPYMPPQGPSAAQPNQAQSQVPAVLPPRIPSQPPTYVMQSSLPAALQNFVMPKSTSFVMPQRPQVQPPPTFVMPKMPPGPMPVFPPQPKPPVPQPIIAAPKIQPTPAVPKTPAKPPMPKVSPQQKPNAAIKNTKAFEKSARELSIELLFKLAFPNVKISPENLLAFANFHNQQQNPAPAPPSTTTTTTTTTTTPAPATPATAILSPQMSLAQILLLKRVQGSKVKAEVMRPETTYVTNGPAPPKHRGCYFKGKHYAILTEAERGQTGTWCYGSYCNHESKMVHWNDHNCAPIAPVTQAPTRAPPPTTTQSSTMGCWYNNKWYMPGADISNGRNYDNCFGVYCNYNSKVISWQDLCSATVPPPVNNAAPAAASTLADSSYSGMAGMSGASSMAGMNTGMGADMGTGMGTGMGADMGTGMGTDMGTGMNMGSSMGMGSGTGMGMGSGIGGMDMQTLNALGLGGEYAEMMAAARGGAGGAGGTGGARGAGGAGAPAMSGDMAEMAALMRQAGMGGSMGSTGSMGGMGGGAGGMGRAGGGNTALLEMLSK